MNYFYHEKFVKEKLERINTKQKETPMYVE